MAKFNIRPNYRTIIPLTLVFGAVAGISTCANNSYYARSQTDTIYQIESVRESTNVPKYGVLNGVVFNEAASGTDQWENERDITEFVFLLKDYSPSDFIEGTCFQPLTSGRLISDQLDLHAINPVPCPTAE